MGAAWTMIVGVALNSLVAGLGAAPAEIPSTEGPLELESGPLPEEMVLHRLGGEMRVNALRVSGIFGAEDVGEGLIFLDTREQRVDRFGDSHPEGEEAKALLVQFRRQRPGKFPDQSRDVHLIAFRTRKFEEHFRLCLSTTFGKPHRLLVTTEPVAEDEASLQEPRGTKILRSVELFPRPWPRGSFESVPLHDFVRFQWTHWSGVTGEHFCQGAIKHYGIAGFLGKAGTLDLNPNCIALTLRGDLASTTLVGYSPTPCEIRPATGAIGQKPGVTLYDIQGYRLNGSRAFLALAESEEGDHRLVLEAENGQRSVYRLRNLDLLAAEAERSKRSPASAPEERALAQLRQEIGFGFRCIARLDHIVHLTITRPLDAARLGPSIAGLSYLEELHLSEARLGKGGLEGLESLQSLEVITFFRSSVNPAGLSALAKLPKLLRVSLTGCPGIDDPMLGALAAIPGIEEIWVLWNEPPEARVAQGRGPAGPPRFTNAGLRNLVAARKSLRQIRLHAAQITGEALSALESLEKLELIELQGARISDQEYARLKARFPHLVIRKN